jgi:hypothetical protein
MAGEPQAVRIASPLAAALAVLATLGTPAAAPAATLRVPADFASISAAVEAAQPCDEVLVSPGTWAETVFLREAVSLVADGEPGDVVVDGGGAAEIVVQVLGGATLRGFRVTGGTRGVQVFGNQSEIADLQIDGVAIGISVYQSTAWIHDVSVDGASETALRADDSTVWVDDSALLGGPVGIDFTNVSGRVLRASVSGAERGLRLQDSSASVTDSTIEGASVGAFVTRGSVSFGGCDFVSDTVGLHVVDGAPDVLDSSFVSNGYGVLSEYSQSTIHACEFRDATLAGLLDGIDSETLVTSSWFDGNAAAVLSQFAGTLVWNVDVSGGGTGVQAVGGAPDVRNSVFVDISGTALDFGAAENASAAYCAFSSVADPGGGAGFDVGDGTHVVAEAGALGYDVENASTDADSPLRDAGDPGGEHEDVDGSRNDIGRSGGPHALDAWQPGPGLGPVIGEQPLWSGPEGEGLGVFVQDVHDPDGDPLLTWWDLDPGDGLQYCDGWANGATFVPPDEGTFTLRVRVTTADGSVEADVPVEAWNTPPSLTISWLRVPAEREEGWLLAEASDRGPQDLVTLRVDWDGDGSWDGEGLAPGILAWTPAAAGTFTTRVEAADEDGGAVEATIEAVIEERAAGADGEGDDGDAGCACRAGVARTGGGPGPLGLFAALGLRLGSRRRVRPSPRVASLPAGIERAPEHARPTLPPGLAG